MSSSSFPISPDIGLVIDASVVINLNATGRASEILAAFPNPFSVTEIAFGELARGERSGHRDSHELRKLLDTGLVGLARLGIAADAIFSSLIEGPAVSTLDDGEAATIASAIEAGGLAVIDERKARNICAANYPDLTVIATADLLIDQAVHDALGPGGQIDAIVAALRGARMRVPPSRIERIVSLIGNERALACNSLPKSARIAT
jgi:predicted nucleic acid-binding protein